MKDEYVLYEYFMGILKKKIPHKATLSATITDILLIDKDAVYRRLRGEVNFTFPEIALISKKLGISLDEVIGMQSDFSRPSQLKLNRHVDPSETDYRIWDEYVQKIAVLQDDSKAEMAEASNMLPQSLFLNFEYLTRFYFFKWEQSASCEPRKYREILCSDRLRKIHAKLTMYLKRIDSCFLLDFLIFQHIVTEIKYYAGIYRMEQEDVQRLKEELFLLLDYMEKITVSGKFEETGHRVDIFISDINIDTNFFYIKGSSYGLSVIKVLTLASVTSIDEETVDLIQTWINCLKHKSTLISVSGGKKRTLFFDAQRKIIETL
ncbi:MAG: hypothetical protein LBR08_08410 [Bacteroidales bacterium]|jgi:hypothetical protein|nr:hypothetical protein [Bacteroidales bacterium]